MLDLRKLLPVLLAALALALAACGDDDEEGSAAGTGTSASTAPAETQPEAAGDGEISKDTKTKPAIPQPTGEPPAELESEDIVKGTGATAAAGDNVTVQYVGVNFSNGAEFDASWDRGQPFEFTLGSGQVIPGWDQGVEGMKEGGRRKLTIPSELAYGPQGSPPAIGPDETLVFVIDLEKVTKGQG